jgi:hypothetical protein
MVGMTNETQDDRFEQWVRKAAQGYNRPPDIAPRDAMWDEIQARSRNPEAAPSRLRQTAARWSRTASWRLAAAAMLLVAAGIGIGYVLGGGAVARQTASAPQVVEDSSLGRARAPVSDPSSPAVTPRQTVARRDDSARAPADAAVPSLYEVAAGRHFTAASALLTSYRASETALVDDLTRRWARDLLTSTRLLLDSPAGNDATRRRLLEDLEVILLQIAQLPAHDATLDRELIERSIRQKQVLTRIRTSMPAGSSS